MQITPQRIIRAAGNRAEVAFRSLLRLFIPFDPWHRMPLAAKDYAVRLKAVRDELADDLLDFGEPADLRERHAFSRYARQRETVLRVHRGLVPHGFVIAYGCA